MDAHACGDNSSSGDTGKQSAKTGRHLLKPFKLAIFSIALVESDSFLEWWNNITVHTYIIYILEDLNLKFIIPYTFKQDQGR